MKVHSVIFSPTGTSSAIAGSVASAIASGRDVTRHDVTTGTGLTSVFDRDDVVVAAVPVYGGHIAPPARQRFDGIRGDGTPCVAIAVYGNRGYEGALCELAEFLTGRGFKVVAAGAFVGEHSYSTPSAPIAAGRPDSRDISEAALFGTMVAERLKRGILSPVDINALTPPPTPAESITRFREFVAGYQRRQAESPVRHLPVTDSSLCNGCGTCVTVCPTGAVTGDPLDLDPSKCIKCCACVKSCPSGARALHSPFAPVLTEYFNDRKPPVWIV